MKFKLNYQFNYCHICESKELVREKHGLFRCKNGCCKYDIDPQGESVVITLFNEKTFIVGLYEHLNFHWSSNEEMEEIVRNYEEAINYWTENNRYLAKILGGK